MEKQLFNKEFAAEIVLFAAETVIIYFLDVKKPR